MGQILTHAQALGWRESPWWQTLYIVSWQGRGEAKATVKCENGHVEFTHENALGESVYQAKIPTTDADGLTRETGALVEHLECTKP